MDSAADFLGAWRFARRLTDHLGTMSGTVTGTVTFTPDDAGLIYQEAGMLTLQGGQRMTAERRYLWRWTDDGIVVLFDDGRDFHQFTPSGLGQGTTHLCGPDTYNVTYDFRAWPQWQAVWQVTGPRKNYTSETVYSRA